METQRGFWSGMPSGVRLRLAFGLAYLGLSVFVLSWSPTLGVVLLMAPILWTVLVIWIGSEDGLSFGPYRRQRETAFGYTLNHLWLASGWVKVVAVMALTLTVVGGLGWLSTEKMRAERAEPTLTERVTSVAEDATEATKETASGWFSTAKGWFSGDVEE